MQNQKCYKNFKIFFENISKSFKFRKKFKRINLFTGGMNGRPPIQFRSG